MLLLHRQKELDVLLGDHELLGETLAPGDLLAHEGGTDSRDRRGDDASDGADERRLDRGVLEVELIHVDLLKGLSEPQEMRNRHCEPGCAARKRARLRRERVRWIKP